MIVTVQKLLGRLVVPMLIVLALAAATRPAFAQPERAGGGEANLVLPDLSVVEFGGVNARTLLTGGLVVCALGLGFGLFVFKQLKNLPVHQSMREVSELIYETCKTYLTTQGKFILVLWAFIAVVIAAYFGWLAPIEGKPIAVTVPVILLFSLIGIGGSYGVAWFGIRVNTFANSRAAFASLRGRPYPIYAIPLRAGMSVGMLLISVELFMMLCILLFIPGDYAGPCFIGFAIGESLGAAALPPLWWPRSIVSVALTYIVSYLLCRRLAAGTLWWKLSPVITWGTLAGAITPELVKIFASVESRHVRKIVISSREGGASLNILSGFVAGNFSAYWLGLSIVSLMTIAYYVSTTGLAVLMVAPSVFAFGLVAFGFLGMGPVTIAVDSYGPVTDNAQSVFELSVIEHLPGIRESLKREYGFDVQFQHAKEMLEENDGAGNTFKATAKPVLIGTAVVGATTMIFSIIVALTAGLTRDVGNLSILYPPF